jgi:hypothetical protein
MIKNEMSLTDAFYIYFQRYVSELADITVKVVIGYNDMIDNSAKEETIEEYIMLPPSIYSAVVKYPKYAKQILSDVFKKIINNLIEYNKLVIVKKILIIQESSTAVRIQYNYILGDYEIPSL